MSTAASTTDGRAWTSRSGSRRETPRFGSRPPSTSGHRPPASGAVRTGALEREAGRRQMDLYAAMGCRPTWTCAPYQLAGPSRLRRTGRLGRVQRHRVLQLGARRADEPLRRLPGRLRGHHRSGAVRRPASRRGASRDARRATGRHPGGTPGVRRALPGARRGAGTPAGSSVAAIDGPPAGSRARTG